MSSETFRCRQKEPCEMEVICRWALRTLTTCIYLPELPACLSSFFGLAQKSGGAMLFPYYTDKKAGGKQRDKDDNDILEYSFMLISSIKGFSRCWCFGLYWTLLLLIFLNCGLLPSANSRWKIKLMTRHCWLSLTARIRKPHRDALMILHLIM